jgi:GxxExxY protein
MNENEFRKIIVDSAIEVHRELGGPGLLEGVYEEAMVEELTRRGLRVERQLQVPILYKGKRPGVPLRLDLKLDFPDALDTTMVLTQAKAAQTKAFLHVNPTKNGKSGGCS